MANIKSSAKRAEIDMRNRGRNRARISSIKSLIKSINTVEDGEKASLLKKIYKLVDTVATKGTIHKNKAARIKSNAAKKLG